MTKATLAIIGGSGLYQLPGLTDVVEIDSASAYGQPSAPIKKGRFGDKSVLFLPRHGNGHQFSPSDINYRANIDALKRQGATDIIAVSACGSFREHLPPGSFILVDQFVDCTFRRENSFFGAGCVAHVSMAHPVSAALQDHIAAAADRINQPVKRGGTYVCIEGPQFSTTAESVYYRNNGFDVVGMTAMPEAKLAREAEISYATIAMVTDFDSWHPEHHHVTVSVVVDAMRSNTQRVAALLSETIKSFPDERLQCPSGAAHALDHAIMTAPELRDPAVMARLDAVAGRVLRRLP